MDETNQIKQPWFDSNNGQSLKNCLPSAASQPLQSNAQAAITTIDAPDMNKTQANTPCVNDTFDYFMKQEVAFHVNAGYIVKQDDLNEKVRAILAEVHHNFTLKLDALYLTVAMIVHYLERRQVIRQHLQPVGVTALLLAGKYEEIYPPEVCDLVYVTDRAYKWSRFWR